MIAPDVDSELGRLVTLLMERPYPLERHARMAEIDRRMSIRAHMLEVGRGVKTAAELRATLAADGTIADDKQEE